MPEQAISLTLNPFQNEPEPKEEVKEEVEEVLIEDHLSDAERKMVDDFAKQIDINNSEMILYYGAAAQNKMTDFSENTLKTVKTKDLGEIGNVMSDLITELKSIDDSEEEKGFSFFKKVKNKAESLKVRYTNAEKNKLKGIEQNANHTPNLTLNELTLGGRFKVVYNDIEDSLDFEVI